MREMELRIELIGNWLVGIIVVGGMSVAIISYIVLVTR